MNCCKMVKALGPCSTKFLLLTYVDVIENLIPSKNKQIHVHVFHQFIMNLMSIYCMKISFLFLKTVQIQQMNCVRDFSSNIYMQVVQSLSLFLQHHKEQFCLRNNLYQLTSQNASDSEFSNFFILQQSDKQGLKYLFEIFRWHKMIWCSIFH